MEMRVYVANLGKYNEGLLVGDWFDLPVDMEEVAEKIGLNANYEEYAIHDYELPFEIGEYTSIDKLNEVAETIFSNGRYFDDHEVQAVGEILDYGIVGDDWQKAIEMVDDGDVRFYFDCDTMQDVAYEIVEECGYLNEMPEQLRFYFDYEKFARDIDIEGTFIELDNNVYMEVIV